MLLTARRRSSAAMLAHLSSSHNIASPASPELAAVLKLQSELTRSLVRNGIPASRYRQQQSGLRPGRFPTKLAWHER
jgi:hypothetical protein